MLKKLRNRSLTKNHCEQMEFAKKLRHNNNGKTHINLASNLKLNQDNRKISENILTESFKHTDKSRKQSYNVLKENIHGEEYFPAKKRRKISAETFPLVDERNRTHLFPLFRENQYPIFKHESFIPVIELEMDNDVLSDDELIDNAEDGIYKNLQEVLKGISNDSNFLKNNVTKRTRTER